MAINFSGHKQHYIVDNEADISVSWEAGSVVWVNNSSKMYMMLAGGAYFAMSGLQTYVNGTAYQNAFSYFASATVSSGVATFYLTDNGASNGNAVFKNNVFLQSLNLITSDASNQFNYSGFTVSGDKKSITVTVNKIALSLGVIVFTSAANGTIVYLQITGN